MNKVNYDYPLINLSGQGELMRSWTVRNAVEGVQIFGGIGSGKTSGSGRTIALKYLSAGFGGLVLTVKPDEKELWQGYCKLTGRSKDLIIVEPGQRNYFNFLEYESRDGGMTENIVQILKTVIRANQDKSGGGSDDPFWENALDMLLFNVIDLCQLAYGEVSAQRMYDIVQTIPRPETTNDEIITPYIQAFEEAKRKVNQIVAIWERDFSDGNLKHCRTELERYDKICDAVPEARTLRMVDEFFGETYYNLSEKTRSIIDFSFSGFLHKLLRDPLHTLFCNKAPNFAPEQCLDGKIILINLPVKTHHKAGRDCQIMFKYIWQRAMEKRNVKENGNPVFLWADEAQNFIHEHDAECQATARSSLIATVYLTQNLPNYHANMGGAKSREKVSSFLGTLATKIFHANADVETNKYASELIGDAQFEETSRTATAAGQFSASRTKSLRIDRVVRPEDMVRLKTGGEHNNFKVEGYIHVQGTPIKDGFSHSKIMFDQNLNQSINSNINYNG